MSPSISNLKSEIHQVITSPVSTQSLGASARSGLLANLALHSVAHGVVDAACAATVFSIFFHRALPPSQSFGFLGGYCGLVFGARPLLGLVVYYCKTPRLAAALGCVLA